MKVVIQCAASKSPRAGHFRAVDGRLVKFVANPAGSAQEAGVLHARPDDLSDKPGLTWRQRLVDEAKKPDSKRLGLVPAYRLYANSAYTALVERYGEAGVFILSAGWGLIRADFPTPQYDITFSAAAAPAMRRRKGDRYADFRQLEAAVGERVVFFGGKDYLPLFCALTSGTSAERVVFYNSATIPSAPNCRLIRYETTTRTNWHYSCVADVLSGRLSI